jgi:hypothetical protein
MFDPIFLNRIRVWYNGLYRGERYMVIIGLAFIILTLLMWVTREPAQKISQKYIIIKTTYQELQLKKEIYERSQGYTKQD